MIRFKSSIFLVLLLFFLYNPAFSSPRHEVVITGEVKKADGKSAGAIPVSLMEITMADQPSIRPFQNVRTSGNGSYSFTVSVDKDSATNHVFYRISVDLDGFAIGSEPFRLDQNSQPMHIDLTLPDVKYGFENLTFPKEILIFENLQEVIRVTGILYVTNSTGGLVNAKKIPFKRSIQASAENIRNLGNQENVDIGFEPGNLLLGITLMEGSQEVFYSYDLPVSGQSVTIDYFPIPGMKEIEFTTPDKATEIELDDKILNSSSVLIQQKQAGNRIFHSKIVSIEGNPERIPLIIKGISLHQSKLLYPAFFLLFILLGGLILFLMRTSGFARKHGN